MSEQQTNGHDLNGHDLNGEHHGADRPTAPLRSFIRRHVSRTLVMRRLSTGETVVETIEHDGENLQAMFTRNFKSHIEGYLDVIAHEMGTGDGDILSEIELLRTELDALRKEVAKLKGERDG